MFDSLTHLVSGSPVTYLVVLGIALLDVLCPILPAETVLFTAAVLAARGNLSIWLLIPAAALGGFGGDNISYLLGRKLGDPVSRKLFRSEKAQPRLRWAERAIQRHGPVLIVVARFLPGGRSGTTFGAGTLELGWRRFATADAAAALAWATYATLLGYLGGSAFSHSLWKPLVASLAVGALMGVAAEGYRRLQRRRGRDIMGDELEPEESSSGAF